MAKFVITLIAIAFCVIAHGHPPGPPPSGPPPSGPPPSGPPSERGIPPSGPPPSGPPHPDRPMCPLLKRCIMENMFVLSNWPKPEGGNAGMCHEAAKKVTNCFQNLNQEDKKDICRPECHKVAVFASRHIGASIAHHMCPRNPDCPQMGDMKLMKEEMMAKLESREICNNNDLFSKLNEKRQQLENFKGDLMECDPSGMMSADTFDMIEAVVSAHCAGCDIKAAGECFHNMDDDDDDDDEEKRGMSSGSGSGNGMRMKMKKHGSPCGMYKAILGKVECVRQKLSMQSECGMLVSAFPKVRSFIDRTIGRVCEAELEYKGICGKPFDCEDMDRKRRSVETHANLVESLFVRN